MKRLTIFTAAMILAGCGVDNRTSIQIRGRALAQDLKKCSYSPSGEFILGNDSYDLAIGGPYPVALYVQNNLVDPKTLNPSASTESNAWNVEAVRVRVNPSDYVGDFHPSPALASITGEVVVPATTSPTIEPGGGQATVYTGSLLSDGVLTALASVPSGGQIVMGVTLQGHTNDGRRLDSGELVYVLEIVNGGRVLCSTLTCPTGSTATCFCDGQVLAGTCL
jgi:hypothetical protein